MGDSDHRDLPVYLPPQYDSSRSQPYPLFFLLAGWGQRGERFLNSEGVFGVSLPQRLDQAIRDRVIPPVLVAFPDCGSKLGASQYINSPATGAYMDFLCDELVPLVDQSFHTYRSREHRGILGHSSGGFGALVTGMLRPEAFAYVGSAAGDTWHENLYLPVIPKMVKELQVFEGPEKFIDLFLADPNPLGRFPRDRGETMMTLSMCPCYAPNLEVPTLKGDLYFEKETGKLIPEVWEKFLSWDPVRMVDRHVDSLGQLKWISLDAGSEDEYGMHLGHRQLSQKLAHHGIDHHQEEYSGRHGGDQHRFVKRIGDLVSRMEK